MLGLLGGGQNGQKLTTGAIKGLAFAGIFPDARADSIGRV